jgi:histidine triad (HIT) family protein
MDDLFLKILAGEIPSEKIYEDERTFAILDINPHNKGHALVIPKERYRNIFDIPEKEFCAMARAARKLARVIKEVTGADGINIGMNNEKAAGQEILHAHLHIIPRFNNDRVYQPARHTSYEVGEAAQLAEKIKALVQ